MGVPGRYGCFIAFLTGSLFVSVPVAERATRAGEVSAVEPATAPCAQSSRTGGAGGRTTVGHPQPSLLLLAGADSSGPVGPATLSKDDNKFLQLY